MTNLDEKIKDIFPEESMHKTPDRYSLFSGVNVPSFIKDLLLKKFSPALYKGLGVYLPLITTNCAVLGVTINNIIDEYTFIQAMVSSLGCGLGFLLAMVLFSGLRSRIDDSNIPTPFKGLAATLIAASFISLAFMGFSGIVENIFA